MTPSTKATLSRLFAEEAVTEAMGDLKADLTKQAISSINDEDTRKKYLHMLWGLEKLITRIKSNTEYNSKSEA